MVEQQRKPWVRHGGKKMIPSTAIETPNARTETNHNGTNGTRSLSTASQADGAAAPDDLRSPRIAVLIPAHNEERFIGSVILQAMTYASDVVVIDDGSSDATSQIAMAAGAVVLRHETNLGKGAALNTGLGWVTSLAPDAVVLIDGDGQHLPTEIMAVVQPVLEDRADVVIGSRYLEHTSKVPRHRVLGHHFFNLIGNQVSGVHLTDSQSGFRAFSRRALEAVCFHSDGLSVESEMQLWARESQLRVMEVPITIRYIEKPKRPVFVHGLMVLSGILRLVGQYRPMLYFGVMGSFLLVAGGIWGLWIVRLFIERRTLAIGYSLIGVLLMVIGAQMIFSGIILHSVRGLLLSLLRPKRP